MISIKHNKIILEKNNVIRFNRDGKGINEKRLMVENKIDTR
jgi:hypothetical protein